VHGTGLYNRLPILPDLPVAKVREMGRFVRSRRPAAGRELAARGVVEACVAMFRLMAGPMRMDVDAVIGDLEEGVAKHNLDFLHVPCVVIHGTVPCPDGASHLYPRYRMHTVYPFACLTSDIASALPPAARSRGGAGQARRSRGTATWTCGTGRSPSTARAAGPAPSRSATTPPPPSTATSAPAPGTPRPTGRSCGSASTTGDR
jgi:hypothetical protein